MLLESPWGESPFPFLKDCAWTLVECEDCAQVYHLRVLTPEWTERRFTKWMSEEAIQAFRDLHGVMEPQAVFQRARKMTDHVLCIEKMTRELRDKEAIRLLDFGCGDGRFITLANAFGMDAQGVDRSTARRQKLRGQVRIHASVEAYRELHPEPVHVATLFEVLEHLEEPMAVLQSLHGMLVPSGLLVAEVPNAEGVRHLKTMDDLVVDGVDHLNAFTPVTLKQMVQGAGFTPVSRPTAHVSADVKRLVKREVRRVVGGLSKPSTRMYFRKVEPHA
ncbi:MAG: class I SAM-dependent methyltransferase [Planctomycetota bacterium]